MNKESNKKKPLWKKWWFWAIIVVIVILPKEKSETNNMDSSQNVESTIAVTETTEQMTTEPTTMEESESTTEEKETETITQETEETQEESEQESIEKNIREAIENVVGKEMLETFNYVPSNNFSLIKFKGSENLTNNMTIKGMYMDIFNILKDIQPMIDTDVDFNVIYPLVDQYGNAEDVIVIKATFTNETIKKINFENAIWENTPVMADDWWNHNAVNMVN